MIFAKDFDTMMLGKQLSVTYIDPAYANDATYL